MRAAFSLSILLALGAATLSTAFSAMAALWVVRHPGWWSGLVQGLFLAPLIFPAIILGVALLLFYKQLGIPVLPGLIIGHVLVGLPYSFRVILVSLHSYDLTQEEASASLGAGPLRTFLLITLPQIWPGVIAGWFSAFIESFGNINISLFLSGPGLATLPVEIFAYLQFQGSRLVIAAASALQILLILVLLIIFGQLIGVDRVARTR
jgi:putative spermidine/putrescine transport system permease protein